MFIGAKQDSQLATGSILFKLAEMVYSILKYYQGFPEICDYVRRCNTVRFPCTVLNICKYWLSREGKELRVCNSPQF